MVDPTDLDRGSPPPVPRWVRVFGIVLAVLVLILLAVLVLSGGQHGPGRHLSSAGAIDASGLVVDAASGIDR